MRSLSSRTTPHYKLVPALLSLASLVVLLGLWVTNAISKGGSFAVVVIPLGIAIFGYLVMRGSGTCLADEVWDDGESLLVRNAGQEVWIDLVNIIHVYYSSFDRPPKVAIALHEPCLFGKVIEFIPSGRSRHFDEAELLGRIDQKKRRMAAQGGGGNSASSGASPQATRL